MNYKEDLKGKLPELKKIEGFPIGADEDILALSEPSYYTTCPNPYIADFIKEYGKPYDEATDDYHREPYVGDVSEGKKDSIYGAHTYHTKVPYKAILPYIQHYTKPNDIVLDAFCGTGMTGIAAQITNRKVILSDLSPVASLISKNYNSTLDLNHYNQVVAEILNKVESECEWMYQTIHSDGKTLCKINFVVWSQVFLCPFCKNEYVFFNVAINKDNGHVLQSYNCPNCNALINKIDSDRVLAEYDDFNGDKLFQTKQVPVLINYNFQGKEHEKTPDDFDLEIIKRISELHIPYWYPTDLMMGIGNKWGDIWRAGIHLGMTRVHHFYLKRTLYVISAIHDQINKIEKTELRNKLLFLFTGSIPGLTKQQRYRHKSGFPNMILSGTIYVGSLIKEYYPLAWFWGKLKNLNSMYKSISKYLQANSCSISCSSAISMNIPLNSIDYIFTDPPFGDNLMYSELNFIWESWIKVFTNNDSEAIINNSQNKKLNEYYKLMLMAFKEYYRVLKPNRWITVVFHNSRSSVWNAIQEGITKAGFVIAQVSILDKQQGSYKQLTSPGAVEKDLVISAYKPSNEFTHSFLLNSGKNLETDFISQLLFQLPNQPIIERTEKMLYSKMLSFYIQHGYEINMDAKAFYKMLNMSFMEIDGLWFRSEQVERYLEFKKKMKLEGIEELKSGSTFLFVTDEKSALVWLYNFISEPKSFSEIHTAFTQLANIQGDAVPELRELLNHSFIFENDKYRRPQNEPEHNQITEKREKDLLREFESLLIQAKTEKGRIKIVRKEAILFGFETCYKTRRYQDILTVTNKLDKAIIENSSELNDFVEAAEIMVKGME